MSLKDILVMLYKVGSTIRVGMDTFDTITTTVDKAKELVRNDVWEDHPDKAKFVALPDEQKEKVEKPHGLGLLTSIAGAESPEEIAEAQAAEQRAVKSGVNAAGKNPADDTDDKAQAEADAAANVKAKAAERKGDDKAAAKAKGKDDADGEKK